MSRRRLAGWAAVLLQLAVLGGLFVYSQYPLWVGTEVRLATVPVDPRDLFRGQYVRLNYALSRQPEMELPRAGDPVFVRLQRDGALWRADGVRLREPDGERLYLRGTIERVSGGELHIRYGIEAWFAAPEEARPTGAGRGGGPGPHRTGRPCRAGGRGGRWRGIGALAGGPGAAGVSPASC